MSTEDTTSDGDDDAPPKKGKKGLFMGIALAFALGGGGFWATNTGLILPSGEPTTAQHSPAAASVDHIAFVELEPVIVSLGQDGGRHLRFKASLEVEADAQSRVEHLKPRVFDILNSYIRAVDLSMIVNPTELVTLRAQMLRRIQLVAGGGAVRDLLIIEFLVT